MQTSPEEVKFRHEGLTKWLANGLTYWWFDVSTDRPSPSFILNNISIDSRLRIWRYCLQANWAFSIPPPNVHYAGSGDGADWEGMSNRVWGSHVYYETVAMFNKNHPTRAHTASMERPMAL